MEGTDKYGLSICSHCQLFSYLPLDTLTAPFAESWSLDRFVTLSRSLRWIFFFFWTRLSSSIIIPLRHSGTPGSDPLYIYVYVVESAAVTLGLAFLCTALVVLQWLHLVRKMFASTRHEWHFPTKLSPSLLFQSHELRILEEWEMCALRNVIKRRWDLHCFYSVDEIY